MLLTNAELVEFDGQMRATTRLADVRIDNSRITAIGHPGTLPGESVIDARGGALLPGLHDHHVHFLSYAASLGSVACGPPRVSTGEALQTLLHQAPGDGWLRGYGYHESVAGDIDRDWLDRHGPERPIRIQHRTGRLWIMNSPALSLLRQAAAENLASEQRTFVNAADGRIFDADALLRKLVPTDLSMVSKASQQLAALGVTAFNDMTPGNTPETLGLFRDLMRQGNLLQSVRMSGTLALSEAASEERITIGCTKIHLHEAALPDFEALRGSIAASHDGNRNVAIHCVTETELVFALAALREAGIRAGDRIEHASVTPPALLAQLGDSQLTVVTQPGFVFERGDAYLQDIPPCEHDWLYRANSFITNGIPLAFATDMPFGGPNPWLAMHAATRRVTAGGNRLGAFECVTPEFAVAAFLGPTNDPTRPRTIAVQGDADLCLLDRPWRAAISDLSAVVPRATFIRGTLAHLTD